MDENLLNLHCILILKYQKYRKKWARTPGPLRMTNKCEHCYCCCYSSNYTILLLPSHTETWDNISKRYQVSTQQPQTSFFFTFQYGPVTKYPYLSVNSGKHCLGGTHPSPSDEPPGVPHISVLLEGFSSPRILASPIPHLPWQKSPFPFLN